MSHQFLRSRVRAGTGDVESHGRAPWRWREGDTSHGERTLALLTQVLFLLGLSSSMKLLGLGWEAGDENENLRHTYYHLCWIAVV